MAIIAEKWRKATIIYYKLLLLLFYYCNQDIVGHLAIWNITQQTGHIDTMLVYCWATAICNVSF